MNWILDIATALMIVIAAGCGRKKGFVRTLAGIVILVAAIFCASFIAERLSAPITNWIQPKVQEALWAKIKSGETNAYSSLPSVIQNLSDQAKAAGQSAAVSAVKAVVYNIVHTVLYIVSFFVLRFLLTVLIRPLTKLFNRIPLVGGMNKLLGMLIGAIYGILVVCIAAWVLRSFNILKADAIEETRLLSFFSHYSIVELFNKLLAVKDTVAAFVGTLKK